ncbi:MAG: peptidoglycan -binding protein [Pseudolabrys sp.]|nr:peptidoglycan -binding protein [Pseudolabrys sp.]
MALARGRRAESMNYWPGFVDALSTLILGIIFLLTVFVVVQFYLQQEVAGKDTALQRLNAQIAQLTDLLAMEKSGKMSLEDQIAQLRASLAASQGERDKLAGQLQGAGAGADAAQSRIGSLTADLDKEKNLSQRALAQVEALNLQIAALRRQLAALEEALDASEKKDKESQNRIADLGQRLNVALAQRVQELSRYRSEFFGRLRQVLGDRNDVQIVGDRFVFSSEVLFASASDEVSADGMIQLARLAETLKTLAGEMPKDLPWVLQVDGHTDRRPIATARFPSNWELATARALAIVKFLRSQGIPPERLAATGYGEFHPLDARNTEEAYARNRRIELKLTSR